MASLRVVEVAVQITNGQHSSKMNLSESRDRGARYAKIYERKILGVKGVAGKIHIERALALAWCIER